jgi:hypothetical protein
MIVMLMRPSSRTRAVSAANIQTLSMNLWVTVAVDDHGDEAHSLKALKGRLLRFG